MSVVRVLEDRVVDRIAAGEVVERPASVVKELVENAIDAGATQLDIRLRQGGVALVEVTDNGGGMSRDDAMLCIERHATSKIRDAEDLVGVITHGFRGEALPSIASVARLEIRTRRPEDEVGTRVVVDGGTLQVAEPTATSSGSTISMRSLFSHTPARRKFLKATPVELDHAVEAVKRAVLRRPGVGVTLVHDGRELIRSSASEDPAQRIRDLLGRDADVLLPVDVVHGAVHVTGYMAPAGVHRGESTGSVYLYVNGRFVRDAVLRRAITEAWRGAIPQGRHPLLVVGIEVPGDDVDVNVHPQKTEVRFRDPRAVADALANALRDTLRGAVAPRVSGPRHEPEAPVGPLFPTPGRVGPSAHPDDDPRLRSAARWAAADVPVAAPAPAPAWTPAEVVPALPREAPAPQVTPPVLAPEVEAEAAPPLAAEPRGLRALDWLGLHHGRYALLSDDAGVVVVDLERLRRRHAVAALQTDVAAGRAVRPLLVPRVVTLGRAEAVALLAAVDALSALGLELAAMGPGQIGVVAMPDVVPTAALEPLLRAVAGGLSARAAVEAAVSLDALTEHEARGWVGLLDEAPDVSVLGRIEEDQLRRLFPRDR